MLLFQAFDAISAVEMAEHVGLANFQLFLGTIFKMLKKDGLFFMQVRRPLPSGFNLHRSPFSLHLQPSSPCPLLTSPLLAP
jgi:hypothetical protein